MVQHEKIGGATRKKKQMNDFRLALKICNLSDMGYKGAKFTWNNCQNNRDFIEEQLDKMVGNNEWCRPFSDVTVQILLAKASDHKPLLITILREKEDHQAFPRGFKFEASWLLDEENNNIVQEAWAKSKGGLTAAGVA